MILYMYIAPGQGLTTPWGQNFDVNRNLLSLQSYVASFKKSLWSLILYNKCSLAGADSPKGKKFWCQQICLVTSFICCKFKKNLFEVWFYTFFFFHDLIQGTTFWCQQKGLITFPICCKFQRNLFEVWFYTIVFMIKYMYIAPGQETKFWCQKKGLITLPICCKFQRNFFEVWFYTILFMI